MKIQRLDYEKKKKGWTNIENPYWEIVSRLPGEDFSFDGVWRPESYPLMRGIEGWANRREERELQPNRTNLTRRFSWAIPSPGSIKFILDELNGRPVVEIGAGSGYWAGLLSQGGIDVNAYDAEPPREGNNGFHCPRRRQWHTYTDEDRRQHRERWEHLNELLTGLDRARRELEEATSDLPPATPITSGWAGRFQELPEGDWHELTDGTPGTEYHFVAKGGPEALALPENRDRVLFLCWPNYDTDFGADVVSAYEGDTIIYIGEGEGGCCGNDAMFKLLEDEWEAASWFDAHVQWGGIHDRLTVYRRKS